MNAFGILCAVINSSEKWGSALGGACNEIVALADRRRVVGRFRRPLDPGTLMSRMAGMLPFDNEEGLGSLLLGNSGRAFRTAFRLAY